MDEKNRRIDMLVLYTKFADVRNDLCLLKNAPIFLSILDRISLITSLSLKALSSLVFILYNLIV